MWNVTCMALRTRKNIIDVLTKTDLRTKAIYEVCGRVFITVARTINHSDVAATCIPTAFALMLWVFVEIRGLLNHVCCHHLLAICWISTSRVTHRVSLQFV